jgi:hypothetical protein
VFLVYYLFFYFHFINNNNFLNYNRSVFDKLKKLIQTSFISFCDIVIYAPSPHIHALDIDSNKMGSRSSDSASGMIAQSYSHVDPSIHQ